MDAIMGSGADWWENLRKRFPPRAIITQKEFPEITQYFPPGADFSKLKMATESLWAMSTTKQANGTYQEVLRHLVKLHLSPEICTITDATAHIGGNTINFARGFYHVNAVEIDPLYHELLINNVAAYGLKNVTSYFGNYLLLRDKIKQDVLFIDPWWGEDHKQHEKIDMKLGEVPVGKIVDHAMSNETKVVILKLPLAADLDAILNNLSVKIIHSIVLITSYQLVFIMPTSASYEKIITVKDAVRGPRDIEYLNTNVGRAGKYSTRSEDYVSPTSNIQIRTIAQKGNADELARLVKFLGKYVSVDGRRFGTLISMMHKKDTEVFDMICPRLTANRNEADRGKGQAENLYHAYLRAARIFKITPPQNYLDIGCGNGVITTYFGKMIEAENIYGVDPVEQKPLEGIVITKGTAEKLPYPDNNFDFITALVSLHHIKDLDTAVKELYRVMKPGGYLLIKEHDCWNAMDAMMVDLEHSIFIHCLEKRPIDDEIVYHYKNYNGWDHALHPFKYLLADFYYTTFRHEVGPSRVFWGLYQKTMENSKK
jgi:SAM-dependent methyltransferase